jgi:hypothetical protein
MNETRTLGKQCPICSQIIKLQKDLPLKALTCPHCWEIIEMDKEDYEQETT